MKQKKVENTVEIPTSIEQNTADSPEVIHNAWELYGGFRRSLFGENDKVGTVRIKRGKADPTKITMLQVKNEFILEQRARHNTEQTIKSYSTNFDRIFDFLGQEYVNQSDAHKEDVSKNMEHYGSIRTIGASMCVLALSIENFPAYYQDYLRNIKLISEQTIISSMRHLRAIVYYCQKQKWIEDYDITVRDIQPEIKQTFTKYELEKLGKKPRKDNFVEYRNWVMIQYLCATGNRISSMLALDVKDIEFDDNSIVVNVQKNRVPKRMPLQYSLKKILQEYVYYYRTDEETGTPMFNEPLFCNQFGDRLAYTSARDSMHFYFDDRGVEWQGFHKFRHSYAANWIKDGGNPFMLREQLGHTSLAMTNRYANLYGMATRKEAEEHSLINQFPQKQGRSVIKKRK